MAVRKKKAPKTKAAGKAKSAGGRSTKPRGGTASKKGAASSAKKASKAPKPAAKRPAKVKKAAPRKDARKDALREKAAALKEKEREKKEREREKAAALKEKEREKKEREREKAAALKEKEREKKEREREKAAALKLKEREEAQKEKERLRAQAEKEKLQAKLRAEKEAEKKRQLAEKEAEKEAARKAKEDEKARIKAEKEAEKARIIAEREAEKEALRKAKEEERARREAEREAYRKAKEAERERLRAEREAARRLRESKAARASKNAQREGLRVGSSRVYNPAAVPNQSGTTRRHLETPQRFVGVRHEFPATAVAAPAIPPPPPPPSAPVEEQPIALPLPETEDGSQPVQGEARPTPPPPAPVEAIDERYRLINERLAKVDESFRRQYEESFEMSWIHHDSALEGVVYTFQELKTAMDPTVTVVPDSSMQPVCEEIRRHRQAIAYVRELGERKRVPINVDVIKKLYVILHPEEGDVKTVKYRKDIPQHRLYFHEYAPPDKIAYRVRQAIDWLNGPEPKKIKNPLRIAARVHFDLVRTFPFANDSGKVARLLMNVLLLRAGYPPAIIHSTERQRYYEALKGQLPIIVMLVNESITNALMSIEKLLDEYEARV
jgi:hypothetical protein